MQNFSVKKTIQVLNYIQSNANCTDYLKLLKLCFFADRKMLRTFGMPILFDKYCALQYGPVCSQTKNILLQDFDYLYVDDVDLKLIDSKINKISAYDIKISDLGDSCLSVADKEAIDFSISTFNKFAPFDLVEITHDYPEWKKYEDRIFSEKKMFNMDYIDFFSNPTEKKAISKFLGNVDPFDVPLEELDAAKEMFLQNYGNSI